MVFYATFNIISFISPWQFTNSCIHWFSPGLGWGCEMSCPRTHWLKNSEDPVQFEPCASRLLSPTVPLSHAGHLFRVNTWVWVAQSGVHRMEYRRSLVWSLPQSISFCWLMIVPLLGFIYLSPLTIVSTIVMWERSQWLGKNIVWGTGLTITRWQVLDSSKLNEFADNNFKFEENGSKLSKRLENIVGKGEIARNEQFLLFPQCFRKACYPGPSKGVIVWEWVKVSIAVI